MATLEHPFRHSTSGRDDGSPETIGGKPVVLTAASRAVAGVDAG